MVDPAVLEGQRARSVDAEHGDLVVEVGRLEVVGDVAFIARQGLQEAAEHVVERDVMVAGHNDLGARQGVQIGSRRFELFALGALGQIARHHHHMGRDRFDQRAQGRQQLVVDTAEVQIG